MLNGKVYENIVTLNIKIKPFSMFSLTWERAGSQFEYAV